MKYISPYRIYENNESDLTQNIRDILVDLEDDGYNISVKYYPDGNIMKLKFRSSEYFKYYYYIEISRNSLGDTSDKKDQLISFMKSNGYSNYRSVSGYVPDRVSGRDNKARFIYFSK